MNRYVFYNFGFKIPFQDIIKKMLERQYQNGAVKGFLLSVNRKSIIEGQYIIKQVIEESFLDPFGQTVTYERIKYHKTQFKISDANTQNLWVIDPPLRIKDFFNDLLDIVQFDATLTRINFNIDHVISVLHEKFELISIKKMAISDLNIGVNTHGELNVKSENDVLADVKKYLGKKYHRIKSITCQLKGSNKEGSLEIGANGSFLIDDSIRNEVLRLLPYFL